MEPYEKPPLPPVNADDWLQLVRRAERSGDYLGSFDLGQKALEKFPDNMQIIHRMVLALARSGATQQAQRAMIDFRLTGKTDEELSSLEARLVKDSALAANGARRHRLAKQAAQMYQAIFERTEGYYPGINAATTWLIAGKLEKSQGIASRVRNICRQTPYNADETYYHAATEAEASLILGDMDGVRNALITAAANQGDDFSAVASTRRQLRLICALNGQDDSVLEILTSPSVATYTGHIISPPDTLGRFSADAEDTVRAEIHSLLERQHVGYGFGSLAAGADILFAEALLERNAELNVVLPFNLDEFKRVSVAISGKGWLKRFDNALEAAKTVTYATDDLYLGDDVLFTYAAKTAMGLSLLRGQNLDVNVMQLAVWDGQASGGIAGTATDIEAWNGIGGTTHIINVENTRLSKNLVTTQSTQGSKGASQREARAMLFGDVKGFSKLMDHEIPIFTDVIMGTVAKVLKRYGEDVLFKNTWGDGLYVVLRNPEIAAECAIDLQESLAKVDLMSEGLPSHLSLRIGAHTGPVFSGFDPVLKTTNYFGAHVTRTARLEPITPEGHVYVTEQFAAILMLTNKPQFVCEYVGRVPSAKGYGRMRMYSLRRKEAQSNP